MSQGSQFGGQQSQSVMDNLMSWFDDIDQVKSDNAHSISPLTEIEYIDVLVKISKMTDSLESLNAQTIDELELKILINIIGKSIEKR